MADVIVAGAGICGASAAHFLARRGLDVLVLDRAGVSEATTGRGEGNVLVSDKLPGYERDMTVLGRELWHELGERFPAARVTAKGALLLDHPEGEAGAELEPALAPGIRCLHEPGDLQVDPAGLARAILSELPVRPASSSRPSSRGGADRLGRAPHRAPRRGCLGTVGRGAHRAAGGAAEGPARRPGRAAGLIRHKLIEASDIARPPAGRRGG